MDWFDNGWWNLALGLYKDTCHWWCGLGLDGVHAASFASILLLLLALVLRVRRRRGERQFSPPEESFGFMTADYVRPQPIDDSLHVMRSLAETAIRAVVDLAKEHCNTMADVCEKALDAPWTDDEPEPHHDDNEDSE